MAHPLHITPQCDWCELEEVLRIGKALDLTTTSLCVSGLGRMHADTTMNACDEGNGFTRKELARLTQHFSTIRLHSMHSC